MFRRIAGTAALCLLLPLFSAIGLTGASGIAVPAPSLATGPIATAVALGTTTAPAERRVPRGLRVYKPRKHAPRSGASINNPEGSKGAQRRNLARIYRAIQATPGWKNKNHPKKRVRCVRHKPSAKIRIALYSFSDYAIANALIRAKRRCVQVQVLMNDHLTPKMVPAWGKLQRVLGASRKRRSWAIRCKDGCRGPSGPLHTKLFLFSRSGKAKNVVAFGSTNLTGKAVRVQWNDIYFMKNRPGVYAKFRKIFIEMKRDRKAPAPLERNYRVNNLKLMFWPQPHHTKATDRVMDALKQVNCRKKPTGGTGYAGRTNVSINIHAMSGDRGLYIAHQMARMKRKGCRIRVLYGLIAPRIHRYLKRNNVPRRRTIFDHDGNDLADVYSHMKLVAISGVVGKRTNVKVVYTGSENFTPSSKGADEVWVRIPSRSAYKAYRQNFDMIWKSDYYSHPKYAHYKQSNTPRHAREKIPEGTIFVDPEDLEM